ncbi:hypothetical protein [Roseicyclus marinus]|uniref:hypothetical protein n=1 Tax=Roseicyclus marinus TaxID=2161673 RepID=UPI002410A2EA|nr:hypothetical protein [Roseicyclus marinus]MDG3040688.1 hypothetical protein [Roseicyclus marinus]
MQRDVFQKEFPNEKGIDRHTLSAGYDAAKSLFLLSACDAGPLHESMAGDWDHEYGREITQDEMAALWPLIVRELAKVHGERTIALIDALSAEAGIDPQSWSWT